METQYDDIDTYSMCNNTFETSNIKCPTQDQYVAYAISDETKDNLVVYGYIRDQLMVSDDTLFPEALMVVINNYYIEEYIHLIKVYSGGYSTMNVFDLFA